jgi:uncharacterized protein YbbC (DUF1343 family)
MKFFTQVKMIAILILMQGMAISQESNTVLLGIDNLIEMGFAPLAGKRIALRVEREI